jgi:hypothetical protein
LIPVSKNAGRENVWLALLAGAHDYHIKFNGNQSVSLNVTRGYKDVLQ